MRVVAYDPGWSASYEAEAARIRAALGTLVVAVHHIGSTAVPGLAAKPTLDILLEVESVATLDAGSDAMERLGYVPRGESGLPGRRFFRKDAETGERTHHVHAWERGAAEIERHLALRDYLRTHPDEARAYGELKLALAGAQPLRIDEYMDRKDAFVKAMESRAMAWRRSE